MLVFQAIEVELAKVWRPSVQIETMIRLSYMATRQVDSLQIDWLLWLIPLAVGHYLD